MSENKTPEQAWEEFLEHYMPTEEEIEIIPLLRRLYDDIQVLQEHLAAQHHDAEVGCLDYRVVKALGATYELHDYLASRLAVLDPDQEG